MITHEQIVAAAKEAGIALDGINQSIPLYVATVEEMERFYAIAAASRYAEAAQFRKQVVMLRKLVGEIYCRDDVGLEVMQVIENGLNAIASLNNGEQQ